MSFFLSLDKTNWDSLWLLVLRALSAALPLFCILSDLSLPAQYFSPPPPSGHFSCPLLFPLSWALRLLSQELNHPPSSSSFQQITLALPAHIWHRSSPFSFILDNANFFVQSCSQLHNPHLHFKAIVTYPNRTNKILKTELFNFNKTFLANDDFFRGQCILSQREHWQIHTANQKYSYKYVHMKCFGIILKSLSV